VTMATLDTKGGAGGSGGLSNTYFGNGGAGGSGGAGIQLDSAGLMTTIHLTTDSPVTGGEGGAGGISGTGFGYGGVGGDGGIGINLTSATEMSGVSLAVIGPVTGGAGGAGGTSISGATNASGNGGAAIALNAASDMNVVTLTNFRSVTGGAAGGSTALAGSGVLFSSSTLSTISVINYGAITGGSSGAGASGIQFSGSTMSTLSIINNGSIKGGAGGAVFGGGESYGNGGAAIDFAPALTGSLGGMSLINSGTISGGIAGTVGGNGGDAIDFNAPDSGNLTISNYGTIIGGNAARSGTAGVAIQGSENGLTILNWGLICAGSGSHQIAVNFSGSSNTINLLGHSVVRGLMLGTGQDNILNFAFSGLSTAAAAALDDSLAPYLTGTVSSGSVTVRGVKYTWDPLIIEFNGSTRFTREALAAAIAASSYEFRGITSNQQAIGASLDSATTNPAPGSSLSNLFNSIDASGHIPTALEALSPQPYQAYGDLAIQASTAIVGSIDQRIDGIFSGGETIDLSAIGSGPSDDTNGFGKDDDGKQILLAPARSLDKRWGFFAIGDGYFLRGDNHTADSQSASADSAGTLAGIDAKLGDHALVGAFFAFDHADASLGADGSQATIHSYTGGLYTAWHQDAFSVNALAAHTWNTYSSQRNIVFPGFFDTANADTSGGQYTANLDGHYTARINDRLTAGPALGLQYIHLNIDGFNESGAGAADLAINRQGLDSLQSRLGGQVDFQLLTRPNTSLTAAFHAAWQHEYLDNSRPIGAQFQGTGLAPFCVRTDTPLRDAAVLGAGLNITFHQSFTLFADYEASIWSSGYIEQTVNAGGAISF
jgi:uncharacterized protein with beta-barrel porin domain